jgi:hypothetical protein
MLHPTEMLKACQLYRVLSDVQMRSCTLDVLTQSTGQLTLKNLSEGELTNRVCEDADCRLAGARSDLVIVVLPVFELLMANIILYCLVLPWWVWKLRQNKFRKFLPPCADWIYILVALTYESLPSSKKKEIPEIQLAETLYFKLEDLLAKLEIAMGFPWKIVCHSVKRNTQLKSPRSPGKLDLWR